MKTKKYEVRFIYTGHGLRRPTFPQGKIIFAENIIKARKKVKKSLPFEYKIWSIHKLKNVV